MHQKPPLGSISCCAEAMCGSRIFDNQTNSVAQGMDGLGSLSMLNSACSPEYLVIFKVFVASGREVEVESPQNSG